ncbi:hypothetical protein [Actinomadura sp. 9N407]|uniref:hypothetical protein n=1 Tax=Actinomadura sp. 9N407 TaxID=3375154 RepID=UPI0037A611E1
MNIAVFGPGGHITDELSIVQGATGRDAAISAAVDLSVPPYEIFTASSRTLASGLAKAGVRRGAVRLVSVPPGPSGAALMAEHGGPASGISYADSVIPLLDTPRRQRAAVSVREA